MSDGSPTPPVSVPLLAGRYRIGARLGSSVDVTLMEAVDERLGRDVVVRLVHPDLSAMPEVQERFRSLFLALEQVRHPNLPEVLDFGRAPWNGQVVLYVVGERLAGGSLRDLTDRGRTITPSQAVVIGLDTCKALDALHRAGVVHGDVRPGTIVFGADGRLRLNDAGLATILDDATGGAGTMINDVAKYASPEVAIGAPLVPQSDVYSLAFTLTHALTGSVPFVGDSTVATLANRVGRLMPVSADLGALAAVLEQAARPDLADRYNAVEFARALVQASSRLPQPTPLQLVTDVANTDTTIVPIAEPVAPDDLAPTSSVPVVVNADLAALVLGDGDLDGPGSGADDPTLADPSALLAFMPRRRRRRGLLLAALVVLAAAAGGLAWTLTRTEHRVVPVVSGLDEGEALNLLADGFAATVTREADDTVAAGLVIRTEPAAGASVVKGAAVQVHISTGPTLRVLPQIGQVGIDQASATLQGLGLVVKVADPVFDETVPKGTVLRWTVPGAPAVAAGTKVPKGTTVELVPSGGPEPRVVPMLVGQTLDKARAALEALQLVVSIAADPVFHPTAKEGSVALVAPDAGQSVARGSTVVLTVSKGPDLVEVPSPKGIAPIKFAASLMEAGFKIGTIKGTPRWVVPTLTSKGKPVKPGDKILRGSVIDITYPRR